MGHPLPSARPGLGNPRGPLRSWALGQRPLTSPPVGLSRALSGGGAPRLVSPVWCGAPGAAVTRDTDGWLSAETHPLLALGPEVQGQGDPGPRPLWRPRGGSAASPAARDPGVAAASARSSRLSPHVCLSCLIRTLLPLGRRTQASCPRLWLNRTADASPLRGLRVRPGCTQLRLPCARYTCPLRATRPVQARPRPPLGPVGHAGHGCAEGGVGD